MYSGQHCWPTHIPKCTQTYSSSCSSVASKDVLFLSSHWAMTAVHTLLLIKVNSSSAGCQVSAATCGSGDLVLGCLHGCIGLSWTVLSHTFHEVQWHFPGWRMGWWGQSRVAGDACRCSSHWRCWPFSALENGHPWKVKRELVFHFVCWLDCLCVSLYLVETTSHTAQADLDPVILSPSLPEHGNWNCAPPCPVFYGTLKINAGLCALIRKAVDKILANRIYLYLCVFRKYTIWKDSQKWE